MSIDITRSLKDIARVTCYIPNEIISIDISSKDINELRNQQNKSAYTSISLNCRSFLKRLIEQQHQIYLQSNSNDIINESNHHPILNNINHNSMKHGFENPSMAQKTNRYINIVDKLEKKYSQAFVSDTDDNSTVDSNENVNLMNTTKPISTLQIKKRKVFTEDYDFEDPFIDDDEMIEEVENTYKTKRLQTKHDGFFISSGNLEVFSPPKVKKPSELIKSNHNNNSNVDNTITEQQQRVGGNITYGAPPLVIPDTALPDLCRIIHNAGSIGIVKIISTFLSMHDNISKRQVEFKIREIATKNNNIWKLNKEYLKYLHPSKLTNVIKTNTSSPKKTLTITSKSIQSTNNNTGTNNIAITVCPTDLGTVGDIKGVINNPMVVVPTSKEENNAMIEMGSNKDIISDKGINHTNTSFNNHGTKMNNVANSIPSSIVNIESSIDDPVIISPTEVSNIETIAVSIVNKKSSILAPEKLPWNPTQYPEVLQALDHLRNNIQIAGIKLFKTSQIPKAFEDDLYHADKVVLQHFTTNELTNTIGYYEQIQEILGKEVPLGKIRSLLNRLRLKYQAIEANSRLESVVISLSEDIVNNIVPCPDNMQPSYKAAMNANKKSSLAVKIEIMDSTSTVVEENNSNTVDKTVDIVDNTNHEPIIIDLDLNPTTNNIITDKINDDVTDLTNNVNSNNDLDTNNNASPINIKNNKTASSGSLITYDWLCKWTATMKAKLLLIEELLVAYILLENQYREKLTNYDKSFLTSAEIDLLVEKDELVKYHKRLCSACPELCIHGDISYLRRAIAAEKNNIYRSD